MSDAHDRADEELAREALRGDAGAYDVLVRRYMRPSVALAWQYTRSIEDAEDVVQEAFHRAVRALASYDNQRPFSGWFFTIVRNVARSAISRDARRTALAPFTLLEQEPADPTPVDPAVVDDIERAVEALPQMQQACFRLCEVEGFSSVEAGRMLGVGEATVRTHVHRARKRLRAIMAPRRGILGS